VAETQQVLSTEKGLQEGATSRSSYGLKTSEKRALETNAGAGEWDGIDDSWTIGEGGRWRYFYG